MTENHSEQLQPVRIIDVAEDFDLAYRTLQMARLTVDEAEKALATSRAALKAELGVDPYIWPNDNILAGVAGAIIRADAEAVQ